MPAPTWTKRVNATGAQRLVSRRDHRSRSNGCRSEPKPEPGNSLLDSARNSTSRRSFGAGGEEGWKEM